MDTKIKVSPQQLFNFLLYSLPHQKPVLVKGPPGHGKTDIIKAAVAELGYDLIVTHPVVSDPTDFKGMPYIDTLDKVAKFLPIGDLTKIIEAKKPTVFFLDELGQASVSVQQACMSLLLARQVGEYPVSPYVTFMAATNDKNHNAGVTGILDPVKSRFHAILELENTLEDWIKYAYTKNVPTEFIGFLMANTSIFTEVKATKEIENVVSPRTLMHAVGFQMSNPPVPKELEYVAFAGAAGEAFASMYMDFLKSYREFPDLDEIIANPDKVKAPAKNSVKYAVTIGLSRKINVDTAIPILTWLSKLGDEYLMIAFKQVPSSKLEQIITEVPEIVDTFARIGDLLG